MILFDSLKNKIDAFIINNQRKSYLYNIKDSLQQSNFKSYVKKGDIYVLINHESIPLTFIYSHENLAQLEEDDADNLLFEKYYRHKLGDIFNKSCTLLTSYAQKNKSFSFVNQIKKGNANIFEYKEFAQRFKIEHDQELTKIIYRNHLPVNGYLVKDDNKYINVSFFIEDKISYLEIGYLNNEDYIVKKITYADNIDFNEELLKIVLPYGITKESAEDIGLNSINEYEESHYNTFKMMNY